MNILLRCGNIDRALFTFYVTSEPPPEDSNNCGYLREDNWNDWFKYETLFFLTVFDIHGKRFDLGGVKIGQKGQCPSQKRPKIPKEFYYLNEEFFSLGQSEDYYEQLGRLPDSLRKTITCGLRDVVAIPILWNAIKDEDVTSNSLTRDISYKTISGQFKRLLDGGLKLTPYKFSYTPPKRLQSKEHVDRLTFKVKPDKNPPTNVHALIGRNGVGKTRTLDLMTKALVANSHSARQSGKFTAKDERGNEDDNPFASVVTISFSAFDEVELLPEKVSGESMRYFYIGLRKKNDKDDTRGRPKTPERLKKEFMNALKSCMNPPKLTRWTRTIEMLSSDPIFHEAEVTSLVHDEQSWEDRASKLFSRLSSGHKIVLLTITKLVEVVEEKTLVLIDEPEAHLHPPLLSTFVRALSDLLINRNGVAIIATHSPVVLQEIPKSCVWILRRSGAIAKAERPECETFGENVGVLTREVFRLEVAQTGFHKMLSEAVDKGGSFEEIIDGFDDKLGSEAQAILRALVVAKNARGDD